VRVFGQRRCFEAIVLLTALKFSRYSLTLCDRVSVSELRGETGVDAAGFGSGAELGGTVVGDVGCICEIRRNSPAADFDVCTLPTSPLDFYT